MAERPKPGSFVHIEIASTDPVRTRKFCEEVFGWSFEDMPEINYATYEAASGPGGGLMSPMEGQPPGILNYVLSTDVDADLRKIEAAGGRVLRPKMEIPKVGWWALFQEPTGIVLALFQGRGEMPQRERARSRPRVRRAARGGKRTRSSRKGRRGR
jgi:predicted enzyme related to lactoylglutathione lyase